MKRNAIFLITSLWIISCSTESESPATTSTNAENELKSSSIEDPSNIVITDTAETTAVEPPVEMAPAETTTSTAPKTAPKIQTIEEEEEIPPFIYDPMDDPNYIGTPCGDYIDGKCTRHHHHDYEEEEVDL